MVKYVYDFKKLMLLRIILGWYNDYFIPGLPLKIYCGTSLLVQLIFFIRLIILNKPTYNINLLFKIFGVLVGTIPSFILSILTGDRYLFLYCRWDDILDSDKQAKRIFRIHQILFDSVHVFIIIFYILFYICWYLCCAEYSFPTYITGIILRFTIEMQKIPFFLIFSVLLCRVKLFQLNICLDLKFGSDFPLDRYGQVYLNILDKFKKTSASITTLMLTQTFLSFWDSLNTMYLILHFYLAEGHITTFHVLLILRVIHGYVSIVFPVFIMEYIADLLEDIKVRMVEQKLRCTDENRRAEITDMLNLLKEKPIRFRMLRAFPINKSFPLQITSLSITYLVFMLQYIRN
nr:gustatory receptor 18 [Pieris rapae]